MNTSTKAKPMTDFTDEEYRALRRKGDGRLLMEISTALGLKEGKGYGLVACYTAMDNTRPNKVLFDLYKKIVFNRVNLLHYMSNGKGLVDLVTQKQNWPKLVKQYRDKKLV